MNIKQLLNLAFVSSEELWRSSVGRCYPPQPTASSDNTLLNLHNSSDDTQLHSVIIVNYLQTKGCCIQKRYNKGSFVIKY